MFKNKNNIVENNKKETNENNLNKLKLFLNWFKNNKDKIKFLIPIAVISVIIMVFVVIKTFTSIYNLNKESDNLYNLNNFNTKILENNSYTKGEIKTVYTINELINYELGLASDLEKYNQYLNELQSPYSNLMQYIFLPRLNIWKDPFIEELDISIIGAKFLEKNPYSDIKLLQRRSDFIKNVGENNEFNQIEEIIIGDIVEEGKTFYVPINIKFISNSKRSFLLLVEKLSTTSNQKNIALINEFIYNLRSEIKEQKIEKIENLQKKVAGNLSIEKTIGYELHQWLFENKNTELIDNELIENAIKKITVCGNEKESLCFYKFRDKFRSIPSLAYTIGVEGNKNKSLELKKFLKELAPIIKVNKFSFERHLKQNIKNLENIQYMGELQINVYGMGIPDIEVQETAEALGKDCFNTVLSPQEASNKIENTLINIGNLVQTNTNTTSNLRELNSIIENIDKEYANMSNYKKMIKLFEIHRMLKDANLCNN